VADRCQGLTLSITDIKSLMGFRLDRQTMTLNDREGKLYRHLDYSTRCYVSTSVSFAVAYLRGGDMIGCCVNCSREVF